MVFVTTGGTAQRASRGVVWCASEDFFATAA